MTYLGPQPSLLFGESLSEAGLTGDLLLPLTVASTSHLVKAANPFLESWLKAFSLVASLRHAGGTH